MKMKFALLAVVVTAVTAVPAVPAQADAVTSGGSSGSASQSEFKPFDRESQMRLSPAEAKVEAAKDAKVKAAFALRDPKGGVVPNVCAPYPECAPPAASHSLGGRQQAQAGAKPLVTGKYYCGPAAVSEALSHEFVTLSQDSAASQLGTTSAGTGWSTASTGPVQSTLNNNLGSSAPTYIASTVGSATSAEISSLASRTAYDIWNGEPVVNDAYEVATSAYHLVGHPHDRTIMHWFTTYAYSSTGAVINYEDSASSPYVSWGASVPKYSALSATAIAHIVGGRGYVW